MRSTQSHRKGFVFLLFVKVGRVREEGKLIVEIILSVGLLCRCVIVRDNCPWSPSLSRDDHATLPHERRHRLLLFQQRASD